MEPQTSTQYNFLYQTSDSVPGLKNPKALFLKRMENNLLGNTHKFSISDLRNARKTISSQVEGTIAFY